MSTRRAVLLVCDVQKRFRSAIYGFEHMTNTIAKMLKAAQILGIPTIATEQNPRALGSTIPEIAELLKTTGHLGTSAKTKFSMVNDETRSHLLEGDYSTFIITGIESHVCVLQTALELLRHKTSAEVYIVSDAVSSCNKTEIPIALRRLEKAGAVITTSESVIFELLHDAKEPAFKAIAGLIKEEKSRTTEAMNILTRYQDF
ncbi:hypothetical protein IAU60_005309 [Kwoniella sp. DSM 27419]